MGTSIFSSFISPRSSSAQTQQNRGSCKPLSHCFFTAVSNSLDSCPDTAADVQAYSRSEPGYLAPRCYLSPVLRTSTDSPRSSSPLYWNACTIHPANRPPLDPPGLGVFFAAQPAIPGRKIRCSSAWLARPDPFRSPPARSTRMRRHRVPSHKTGPRSGGEGIPTSCLGGNLSSTSLLRARRVCC